MRRQGVSSSADLAVHPTSYERVPSWAAQLANRRHTISVRLLDHHLPENDPAAAQAVRQAVLASVREALGTQVTLRPPPHTRLLALPDRSLQRRVRAPRPRQARKRGSGEEARRVVASTSERARIPKAETSAFVAHPNACVGRTFRGARAAAGRARVRA